MAFGKNSFDWQSSMKIETVLIGLKRLFAKYPKLQQPPDGQVYGF